MRFVWLLALLVSLPTLVGCATWQRSASKYQTVVGDPHRDEAAAIKKTDEAAKAWEKGNLDQAEQLLQEALIADVQYGPAHNNLGLLYYQTQRYYLAAWEFEYAMQTMGHRPEPHNNLGLVFEAVDRLEEAVKQYSMARELDAGNPEYMGNLARTLIKRNENDPALKELLSDLILYDSRPQWVAWARERLATGKFQAPPPAKSSPALENLPPPSVGKPLPAEAILTDELELPPP